MAGAEDGEDGLGEAEPADRAVAHRVAPSDINQGLARRSSRQSFAALMRRQRQLPSELHSPSFGAGAALAGPRKDQAALKLRSSPSTVNINRPCGVVVSAHALARLLKPAPAFATASRTFSMSLVERASGQGE